LEITGFFFRMSTRMRKKKPVISSTSNVFCFNSNVSNLYNNDVIIYLKKIKSRANSFVCERVYLIYRLRHWSNSLSSFIKRTAKTSACVSGLYLILETAFTIALLGYYCTNKKITNKICMKAFFVLFSLSIFYLHKSCKWDWVWWIVFFFNRQSTFQLYINFVTLLADMFLYSYETDLIQ
jgi:hypothetical protein